MAQERSYEERVEDFIKKFLDSKGIKYYTKTEKLNDDIAQALEKHPSKSGGKGKNYPDIQCMITTKGLKNIPVMIECKGKRGDLAKFKDTSLQSQIQTIDNFKENGDKHFANIQKYALNGAIHYADALTFYSNFKECLAIGINGYEEANELKLEYAVYLVSNPNIYQKLGDFSDLSFLKADDLDWRIESLALSEQEIEAKTKEIESQMEIRLKNINETIYSDIQNVGVGARVKLIVGMIMAALGVESRLSALKLEDLKSEDNPNDNDSETMLRKIKGFLECKNLSKTKQDMVMNVLRGIFVDYHLWKPRNAESHIKKIYKMVLDNIMPYLANNKYHLDFTGQLFNVLNRYVDIPDGEKNDVVLTPRYVCELMARLCEVNKDSFVWDYALGTGGFLISSMKLMIKDAQDTIKSQDILREKIIHIKTRQLLGIEKRQDITLLAILNMILMGDGSANVLNQDSLEEFNGNYPDNKDNKQEAFPANIFLLNPPYSAKGKGFIFVAKALKKMSNGKAAVLIQENAGSGNGLPYTKEILTHSTLIASIKMADIFMGKSGVQTAIYLFEVGKAHDKDKIVKFIDFSNDGYERQNRKKSGLNVNLKDIDAKARYKEIVDIVLNRKKDTHYFDECVIEDSINLEGKDWTFAQHKKVDSKPTLEDFKKCVSEYLAWEVSQVLKKDSL